MSDPKRNPSEANGPDTERTISGPPPAHVEMTQAPSDVDANGSDTDTGSGGQEKHDFSFLSPPREKDEMGRLGKYRVLKVLGAGGMGVVFLAENPSLKRQVALKAMLPRVAAKKEERLRFQREAESTAALKHDNIIDIYDVDEDRGIPFLAMPFLKGEPLEDCIRREKRLTVPEALRIGREMAEGLAAAHEKNMIHRDIKPGNVWLEGSRRRVKILDFGLARPMDTDTHLTRTGAVSGTPAYMAPEQARGEKLDYRCDLFSLGCVIYRISTGEMPFKGSTVMALLTALANEEPVEPRLINGEIPPGLDAVIRHLLAKNRELRPASATEVAKALAELETEFTAVVRRGTGSGSSWAQLDLSGNLNLNLSPSGTGIPVLQEAPRVGHASASNATVIKPAVQIPVKTSSTPAAAPPASYRSSRKQRRMRIGLTLLLLCGVVGAGGYFAPWRDWVSKIQASREPGVLNIECDDVKTQVVVEENGVAVVNPTANRKLELPPGKYRIKLVNAADGMKLSTQDVVLAAGGNETVKVQKELIAAPTPSAAAPTPYKAYLDSFPSLLDKLDKTKIGGAERFAWQPEELVAVLGQQQNRHWGTVDAVVFSKDGKLLASGGGQDGLIRIYDATTMAPLHEIAAHTAGISALALSPDAKILISGDRKGTLRFTDLSGGQPKDFSKQDAHTLSVLSLAFSPDGTYAASGGTDKKVVLWRLTSGRVERVHELPWFSDAVSSLAFSRDSHILATGSEDKSVRMWDIPVAGGPPRERGANSGRVHKAAVHELTFPPDGKTLLSVSQEAVRSWLLDNRNTPLPVIEFKEENLRLPWSISADGSCLAARSGTDSSVRSWSIQADAVKPRAEFTVQARGLESLVLSEDGNRAAIGGKDGTVQIYPISGSPIPVNPIAQDKSFSGSIAFSADRRTLVALSADGKAHLWDLGGAEPVDRQTLDDIRVVTVLSLSNDGKQLACGGEDGTVKLWDLAEAPAKAGKSLTGPKSPVRSLSFSPDAKTLAVAGENGTVSLWDLAGDKPREQSLGVAPKGPSLVAFSPIVRLLATAGGGLIQLWDLSGTAPRERKSFKLLDPVHALTFSPDGKSLIAGGDDGVLHLWKITDSGGEQILQMPGHHTVLGAAFAPNGKTVVSVDDRGKILLRDTVKGEQLRSWQLPGKIENVQFAMDGRHLITANGNGAIYVLRVAALQ